MENQWQNSQLHDDLIGSELITQRGGTSVEDDTWLDPDATWRVDKEHHGLPGADVMPLWFCWDDVRPLSPHSLKPLANDARHPTAPITMTW